MNLTTFLIQQLCWIFSSDEVLRLGLKTFFASLSLGLKVSGLILFSKATGLSHKPVVLKLSILQGYGFVNLL